MFDKLPCLCEDKIIINGSRISSGIDSVYVKHGNSVARGLLYNIVHKHQLHSAGAFIIFIRLEAVGVS